MIKYYFFITLLIIFSSSYQRNRTLPSKNCYSEISLILNYQGETNIFDIDQDFFYFPNKTIINGVVQDENTNIYVFENEENSVSLVWDYEFTNASYMFYYADSITMINFTNFDSSHINDMTGMFWYCNNLTSIIGLNHLDTKKVTSMDFLFYVCYNLTSIDLSSFDTTSLVSMEGMFGYCTSLKSIDLSRLDTSKVTDMSFLFDNCTELISINFGNFDTRSVENMESMFDSCFSLNSIDLSNFDTSKVTDMSFLFYDCFELKVINISNFNTSLVESIEAMFYDCKSLKSIDLSALDTSRVEKMSYLFHGCDELISINLSNIRTNSIKNIEAMFFNCYSLESIDLSFFDTSKVVDFSYLFSNCYNLKEINLSNFDTKNADNMVAIFYNCKSLTSINLSNFDTSKVTDMNFLFFGCYKLTSINLSNFITSSLLDMYGMFAYCYSLESIDLSNFDTSKVTDMSYMFYDNWALTSVNLTSFETSNVDEFEYMFLSCKKLNSINLYSFTVYEDADIRKMFYNTSISLKYCYNTETALVLEELLNSSNIDCSWACAELKKDKYIEDKEKCIDECYNDDYYEYEYNKKCYNKCPEGKYIYNLGKCFDEIPEGYYLIAGQNIDKCDESCLTCNGKGTSQNSNCTSCPNGAYLNLGNCTTKCDKGYYNDNGIDKCFCEIQKCQKCSLESLQENLCIICNNNEGYYEKYESSNNIYIECYQSLEGYYVDEGDNKLKPCYESCGSCNEKGDANNHNCLSCKDNYLRYDNSNNCYPKCDLYYYFDNDNQFFCTNNLNCPDGYKLISSKNKCIDNCTKDEDFKYEYNKECYSECPSNTIENNYVCTNKLNCEKYYNYNQTGCLDEIPDGYYLVDKESKLIDKCHKDCLTCEKKETINNSNCKTCPIDRYFNYGNCTSICQNGNYIDRYNNNIPKCKCINSECLSCPFENISVCYNCSEGYYPIENDFSNNGITKKCYKSPKGYYLDNIAQIYKLCYNTCETCDTSGDEKTNNCKTCKNNYSFKNDNPNDNNCYENCMFYYYFDENNNHFCTKENKCPDNYKLISEKGKCISDCSEDDTYKYEYRKKCFEKCPENTKDEKNNYFCENECPKEYPYEIIDNQTCIIDCSNYEIIKQICRLNNKNIDINTTQQKEEMMKDFKNILTNSNGSESSEVMEKIKEGDDFTYKDEQTTMSFTSTGNQEKNKDKNVSTIDFGNCEIKLKEAYHIVKNDSLIIFKIEVQEEGMLIPKTEYEVYYPFNGKDMIQLNLTICDKADINLAIPVNIDENNIDKYDPNSEFYQDICSQYSSKNGIDMTRKDRKNEYVENNLTLCEENCNFTGYDIYTKKALCSCPIKIKIPLISEIVIDKERLYYSFSNIKNLANLNLDIMKCYNVLFCIKGIKNNIGIYLISAILLFHFIFLILFYCKDYRNIKKQMKEIVIAKMNIKKYSHKNTLVNKKGKNNLNINNKNILTTRGKKKKKSKKIVQYININIMGNNKKKEPDEANEMDKINTKRNERKNKTALIKRAEGSKTQKLIKSNIENKESPPIKIKRNAKKVKTLTKQQLKTGINDGNFDSKIKFNKNIDSLTLSKYNNILELNQYELNALNYREALITDKRTYSQYYCYLLAKKHIFIFSFFPFKDYNSKAIKLDLFFFSFSVYFAVNTLFFTEETLHKIYENDGSFNFIYHIPQIIYSSLITSVINAIVKALSLSENNILSIKHKNDLYDIKKLAEGNINSIFCKITFYLIISTSLLFFFWYYIGCFCALYSNTQLHLIKDSVTSFGLSMLYPLFLCLIPGIFRIPSLRAKKKNKECMYKTSKFLELI